MDQRRIRLGDVIDDYCSRCRLIMNHGVVGMVGDEIKKVRCNTCSAEHPYRQGRLPASRQRKARKLFEEVLRGIPQPGARVEPGHPVAAPEPAEEAGDDGAGSARVGSDRPGHDRIDEGRASDAGAGEDHPGGDRPEAPAERPEPTHRRLYTIRRAIAGRSGDKDPKKP